MQYASISLISVDLVSRQLEVYLYQMPGWLYTRDLDEDRWRSSEHKLMDSIDTGNAIFSTYFSTLLYWLLTFSNIFLRYSWTSWNISLEEDLWSTCRYLFASSPAIIDSFTGYHNLLFIMCMAGEPISPWCVWFHAQEEAPIRDRTAYVRARKG